MGIMSTRCYMCHNIVQGDTGLCLCDDCEDKIVELGYTLPQPQLAELQTENARLREALERIAAEAGRTERSCEYDGGYNAGLDWCADIARTTLEGK